MPRAYRYRRDTTGVATVAEAVEEAIRNTLDEEPDRCGCRGGGWHLSHQDTWHPCPLHPREALPEEPDEEAFFEMVSRAGQKGQSWS